VTYAREKRTLGSVYVHEGPPFESGYATNTWFDDYHVAYGINEKRQEAYLESIDFKYWHGPRIYRDHSEGTMLGPQVPLESVDVVYAWKKHETDMKKWMAINCPHAKFVSLEANYIYWGNRKDMLKLAQAQNLSERQMWRKVLREGKVRI
jgi:hypothetical protein